MSRCEFFKEFTFEVPSWLPRCHVGHQCGGLNRHSFRVCRYVDGLVYPSSGRALDFMEVKARFESILDRPDRRGLNDKPPLWRPKSINIERWIWDRTKRFSHSIVTWRFMEPSLRATLTPAE
ncbi:MAG: 6-carboxytetrahydropterin synthase [Fimbriimonadales bacterium]|nr:6-carboxytetrahydropterin synthase [Fimbriimonadales bacterium]